MEKVRIGNDMRINFSVYRNGEPESFDGASNIVTKLVNEAYNKEITHTHTIAGNIVQFDIDALQLTQCGKCRLFISYTKGGDYTVDSPAFELVNYTDQTGGTEIIGVEIVSINISGDIGINRDGLSAYEVWESYPGNEGKTIEQYFDWLRENPAKVDTSRTISAGNGLTGGGSLTEDITININPVDDSLTVTDDNIKVNTNNTLASTSTTQPLSAKQGKALQDNKADKSRKVNAGLGLTGGGDLAADRTIDVVSANDGITVNADNIQLNTIDNVTSTSVTKPLSANQGKVLNDKVVQVETDLNQLAGDVNIEINGVSYDIEVPLFTGTGILEFHDIDIKSGVNIDISFTKINLTSNFIVYLQLINASDTVIPSGDFGVFASNTKQLTISEDVAKIRVFIVSSAITETGLLVINVDTDNVGIKGDIDVLYQQTGELQVDVEAALTIAQDLDGKVNTKQYLSDVYNVTQGQAINTSTASIRFYPTAAIKANRRFGIKLDYPEGNIDDNYTLYFYKTISGSPTNKIVKNGTYSEFIFDEEYTGGIGFYITAAKAIANGTAQITLETIGDIESFDTRISALELEEVGKIRLSDVLYNWIAGEKFAIGFHGDSTTDGVSTTGWTVKNSHPAQDEAAGGSGARGVVDYVCELAYPKQLQNMLRSELNNQNLKIYNIGYYGASLANNYNQLDNIYDGVYADVKMVGIVLGINDRTGTPATYYSNMLTMLTNYVNYFLAKGIIPFMVTNQIVTQNGFDPGNLSYGTMFQDYIQTLSNKAKFEIAKKYDLEIIDMNNFGRLLLMSSSYNYNDLTEGLHFKDLGHELEAGYLFSELVPWVNRTDNAKSIYFGFNSARSKTGFKIGNYTIAVSGFKTEINYTKADTTDVLIFDSYMFNNSQNGRYSVKYHTKAASGYIVINNDTDNPIQVSTAILVGDHYELDLGYWDIGLHHVQVYTGASTTVAFRGFLLEQVPI